MNVKQLKEELHKYPDDMLVIASESLIDDYVEEFSDASIKKIRVRKSGGYFYSTSKKSKTGFDVIAILPE